MQTLEDILLMPSQANVPFSIPKSMKSGIFIKILKANRLNTSDKNERYIIPNICILKNNRPIQSDLKFSIVIANGGIMVFPISTKFKSYGIFEKCIFSHFQKIFGKKQGRSSV